MIPKTPTQQLESDLKDCFFEAYVSQFSEEGVPVPIVNTIKKEHQKSDSAANKFSETLAAGMTEAISNFVKTMQITITVPPTVVCGGVPVTGSIPPTNVQIDVL